MSMLARDVFDLGVKLNRIATMSETQAALDDKARAIARLLFEADAIWQDVPEPDYHAAEFAVQLRYLDAAQAAIALASESLREQARAKAIAATPGLVEVERDTLLNDADVDFAGLAADIATAEYRRQLRLTYRQERGRR